MIHDANEGRMPHEGGAPAVMHPDAPPGRQRSDRAARVFGAARASLQRCDGSPCMCVSGFLDFLTRTQCFHRSRLGRVSFGPTPCGRKPNVFRARWSKRFDADDGRGETLRWSSGWLRVSPSAQPSRGTTWARSRQGSTMLSRQVWTHQVMSGSAECWNY